MSIPLREFGTTGVQISALGLGGHHLGGAKDEKTAIEIVRRALDGDQQPNFLLQLPGAQTPSRQDRPRMLHHGHRRLPSRHYCGSG